MKYWKSSAKRWINDNSTKILIQDMLDTMYDVMGVFCGATGRYLLKQIVTIDVGEGPIVLINPEIIESDGTQTEKRMLKPSGKYGL